MSDYEKAGSGTGFTDGIRMATAKEICYAFPQQQKWICV